MLINAENDMEVVGEAADGSQVEPVMRQTSPDVLLLDITMPAGGGLKALGEVRRNWPQVRVVILTMHEDPAYLRSVLAAGASGYVLKRAVDADLLFAIRAVHRGGTFVDPSIAQNLLPQTTAPAAKGNLLSQRERQVLQLVAEGYTNQQIADRIFVGVKSVDLSRAHRAKTQPQPPRRFRSLCAGSGTAHPGRGSEPETVEHPRAQTLTLLHRLRCNFCALCQVIPDTPLGFCVFP